MLYHEWNWLVALTSTTIQHHSLRDELVSYSEDCVDCTRRLVLAFWTGCWILVLWAKAYDICRIATSASPRRYRELTSSSRTWDRVIETSENGQIVGNIKRAGKDIKDCCLTNSSRRLTHRPRCPPHDRDAKPSPVHNASSQKR